MIEKKYFGEDKNIEFKREIPQRHEKFLKDIIAFSNSSGGKVIVGIEDTTNKVYGIGDMNPFKLSDDISNMIYDACTPLIEASVSMETIDGKTVLVVEVGPGKFRPYYLKSHGKESSTYIRINGTSRPADARRIQELELEGQRISYDTQQYIGADLNIAEALELCRIMKRIALEGCAGKEEQSQVKDLSIEKLEDFGLLHCIGEDLHPTNGYMLLTKNPMKYAKIQSALFKGLNRDVFIDKREFSGPIYEQVEEAYQFVLKHINLGAEIDGLQRRDIYELPINAIREMIVNAVAHRSYLDDSCIQVSIFDDRIEVLSPGMLYGGIDMESAKSGKSKCRNAAICEAFHYMKMIEQWGTGIPRIINQCKEYGLPVPLFEELGDGIRVTMFRKPIEIKGQTAVIDDENTVIDNESAVIDNESAVIQDRDAVIDEKIAVIIEAANKKMITGSKAEELIRIVTELQIEKIIDREDIEKVLKCKRTKAIGILNILVQLGIIKTISGQGKGKYAIYVGN